MTEPIAKNKGPRHYTIPIFIPGIACTFKCIFCDQEKITGKEKIPSPGSIRETVDLHLSTIPKENTVVEIGFFGGTFTGLPLQIQEQLLKTVRPYIDSGRVRGIRLSTRPDFISDEVLDILGKNKVSTIELGAQSMNDDVLLLSGRGHTADDTQKAAKMIKDRGFSLGLQMMVGLPGDSPGIALDTALKFIAMNADNTRIYPVLVIRGTYLETLFHEGKYKPLTLEEAIHWTKPLIRLFEEHKVPVIRVGLHPSEGLLNQTHLVAGPFHPSFRELVMSEIWYDRLSKLLRNEEKKKTIIISVNPSDRNNLIGYQGKNKRMLREAYHEVIFVDDYTIKPGTCHADHR